jgi:hypothetical protein
LDECGDRRKTTDFTDSTDALTDMVAVG